MANPSIPYVLDLPNIPQIHQADNPELWNELNKLYKAIRTIAYQASLNTGGSVTKVTITDSASVTPAATSDTDFTWALTSAVGASRAANAITGLNTGDIINFEVIQPATGGPCAIVWNSNYVWGLGGQATAPSGTTVASASDFYSGYKQLDGKVHMNLIGTTGGGTTSPLTTKGDVYGYSTANARIPVGADATVLTADSTQALGVKWATVAAGGSAVTVQPHAMSAYRLATQTVTQSAFVQVNFDTKEFDTNNEYSTSTFRFLPTVAGYYFVAAQFAHNGTFGLAAIYKNGTNWKYGEAGGSGSGRASVATVVFLNGTTDYVDARIFMSGGSAVAITAIVDNWFQAALTGITATGVPMASVTTSGSADIVTTNTTFAAFTGLGDVSIAASVGDKINLTFAGSLFTSSSIQTRVRFVSVNNSLAEIPGGGYQSISSTTSAPFNVNLIYTITAADLVAGVATFRAQNSNSSASSITWVNRTTAGDQERLTIIVKNYGDGSGVAANQAAGFQLQALPQYDREGTLGTGTGAASRGIAIPLELKAPMYVAALQMIISTTGAGTVNWGLYDYSGSPSSASLLVSGSGVFSSTGSQKLAASAVTLVKPGAYIVVIVPPATGLPTFKQIGSLNTALPAPKVKSSVTITSTIDFTSGWAYDSALPEVVLVGQLSSSVAW